MPSLTSSSILLTATMDAFFTIAPPVPVDAPSADAPVDHDGYGTGGNHGGCTIAW